MDADVPQCPRLGLARARLHSVRWSFVFIGLAALSGCHLVFELEPGTEVPMSDGARTTYRETVLDDGPVAYWRLGTASDAVAVDESGNGNSGTYVGNVLPGAPGALVGDADAATEFDGDDDTITMGDRLSFEGSAAFTIEAWVRPTAHEANFAGIVSKTDEQSGGGIKTGYLLYDQFNRFGCERSDGISSHKVETTELSVDRWTYVAATFDGAMLSLYVDAVMQDSTIAPTLISIPGTSMPFAIGARNGGTWLMFTGSIDEVAIYDHALERSQLENHRRVAFGQ